MLTHTPTQIAIPLPPTAPIPRAIQHNLYSILRDTYKVALILRTGPSQREIELDTAHPIRCLPNDIDKLHVESKGPSKCRRAPPFNPRRPFKHAYPTTRSFSHLDTLDPINPDPTESNDGETNNESPPPKVNRRSLEHPTLYPCLEKFQPPSMSDID